MSGTARYTLLVPLVGPMQSWGSRSRFDDRDTHLEPTRSGIIGLLCAALGVGRGEPLDRFDALRVAVRVDAPGRVMTDYQTAQEVIKADGSGTTAVQSRRHYLAGARFLVALESDDRALLEEIRAALRAPVWMLSLGRKSFPLAAPPYLPGEWGDVRPGSAEEVLRRAPWYRLHRRERRRPDRLRLVLEDPAGESALSDLPLDFGRRRFGLRRVTSLELRDDALPPMEDHPCCTFPD